MLKSELFAQKEKYSNILRIVNGIMYLIMPASLQRNINKNMITQKYRVWEIRNEYISITEKEVAREKILGYLYDFNLKLIDLLNELVKHKADIKVFDIRTLASYTELLQNNIKSTILSSKLTEIQVYSITDLIFEFGILCSSFLSYYSHVELLLEEFSIKEEYLYIGFHKPENKDLTYSEFLLVAELLNLCIKFIFREYSDKIYIHIDSGSNMQAKVKVSELAEGEVTVQNSIKDNIKEFIKGLINKDKNDSAIMIKTAKANHKLIRNFAKDNIELLKEVTKMKEENEDEFFKDEIMKIYQCSSQLSQQNIQMSIDSISSKNSSTLLLEKSVMKQITDTSSIKEIE